jgi:hypothetical protein
MVKVRLIRKLAQWIDGVDLTGRAVGEVVDLPETEARLLVAEEWATTRERRRARADHAPRKDRRRKPSEPLP